MRPECIAWGEDLAGKRRNEREDEKETRPDEWVDFVRYSMADIVARGDWLDFGLFRILNRVSFMSLKQLLFVIYRDTEPEKDGGPVIVDEDISVFDPLFQRQFREFLTNRFAQEKGKIGIVRNDGQIENVRQGELKLLRDKVKRYSIRLFNSQHYVLLFTLEVDEAAPGEEPKLGFKPVSRGSALGRFFNDVMWEFDGLHRRMDFKDIDIEAHLSKLHAPGSYVRARDKPPEEIPLDDDVVERIEELAAPVTAMVDKEYERLTQSPLLRGFLEQPRRDPSIVGSIYPANAFFFGKRFNRSDTRYGEYYYDSIFIIGEKQRAHLKLGLAAARRRKRDFIEFDEGTLDAWFWDKVSSSEGIDEVVKCLEAPLSSHVRLFVENALLSGSTMIKPGIFGRKGLAWLSSEPRQPSGAVPTAGERDEAFKHFTCLHYVLQLGSPVPPRTARNDLSVVSLPFRCSGGIWMAATFLRRNRGHGNTGLLNQRAFEESYLIYHSLFKESERRLRRRAKFALLRQIRHLTRDYVRAVREERGLRGPDFALDQESLSELNNDFLHLSRIYPFTFPRLEHGHDFDLIGNEHFEVKAVDNLFFDRLSMRPFIDEADFDGHVRASMRMSLL